MTFKPEKEAKAYIRGETKLSVDLSEVTLETAIREMDDKFQNIIQEVQNEIQLQEHGTIQFTRFEALKYRFVTMFVSGIYTKRQIADILGITPNTVTMWLNKKEIIDAIRSYQEKEDFVVDAAIKSLRLKALEKAKELLEDENSMVQAIMVRDILDRSGHKPVEKKEVNVTMTYEERLRALANVEYNVSEDVINDTSVGTQINTEGDVASD